MMTYNELVDLFIKDRKTYCSPKTIQTYQMQLDRFRIYLDQVHISNMEDITTETLKAYLLYLRNSGIKSTSIRTYFRHLKAMLSFAIDNEFIPVFKYKIKLPRPDAEPVLPLSQQEADHIIQVLSYSPRNILIFRLMLDMGMRSVEVRQLRRKDISETYLTIYNSKFSKSRILPIPEEVRNAMYSYDIDRFDAGDYIIPISEKAIKSMFARLKLSAGISRLHAHLLRHTFATSYIMTRNNLEYLRCYLGHETYAVTQGYIRLASQCTLIHYDIYQISEIFT